MSDVVIVGVLSLVGTLVGSVCGILAANKLTNYRIEQLEKRMDKHNTVIDRTYNLEQHAGVMDEQMKAANQRIEDLEREE